MSETKVLTTYEYLKQLEDDELFMPLISKGIIPTHILGWISIYEDYMHHRLRDNKTLSEFKAAEKAKCSERTVRNIVRVMKN